MWQGLPAERLSNASEPWHSLCGGMRCQLRRQRLLGNMLEGRLIPYLFRHTALMLK